MKIKWLIIFSSLVMILAACQNGANEGNTRNNNHEIEGNNASNAPTNDNTNNNAENTSLSAPKATLQKTDQSDDVQTLQQVLIELDYPIEATGTFDDVTTWAITDIQLQTSIEVSGIYDEETENTISNLLVDNDGITVGDGLKKPSHPDEYPEIVENPYDILALVNKSHSLPNDYEPDDLVIPDVRFPYEEDVPKRYLRKVAAEALEDLINAGDDDGVAIFGQSGFRSYDRQEAIFASNVEKSGEEHANTYSARAGESEHQTGLVMDVTAQAVGFDLTTDFGDTAEGKWIKDHAHEYGFIIRYTEEKEKITKYQYEPWHLRYVGIKAATEIVENNETLEEYLGVE